MNRIAVFGNAAGGKTTLSVRLGRALGIPVYPLDRILWGPRWVPLPAEVAEWEHAELIGRERWIIDGFGPWSLLARRFDAADTLIFLDHPLRVHYAWAMKRQLRSVFRPRPDLPDGCSALPVTRKLLKRIWRIHKHVRPHLLQMIDARRTSTTVFHIRSPRELNDFAKRHAAANGNGEMP